MIESIVDSIAGLLLPAYFLFGAIYLFLGILKKKKRFKKAGVYASNTDDCLDANTRRFQSNTLANDTGSLTRESMFKDIELQRSYQETVFDRLHNLDHPSYMEHNVNGVPMSGGVDLQGNPFGSTH